MLGWPPADLHPSDLLWSIQICHLLQPGSLHSGVHKENFAYFSWALAKFALDRLASSRCADLRSAPLKSAPGSM